MEKSYDVETFKNILISKGYDGHLVIKVCHFGKLEENLKSFLKDYQSDSGGISHGQLVMGFYLLGDCQRGPSVKCEIFVDYQDGKFRPSNMNIRQRNVLGSLVGDAWFHVTMETLPTAKEVIALVNNVEQKKAPIKNGRRIK